MNKKYTNEQKQVILNQFTNGESVTNIVSLTGIPKVQFIHGLNWREKALTENTYYDDETVDIRYEPYKYPAGCKETI